MSAAHTLGLGLLTVTSVGVSVYSCLPTQHDGPIIFASLFLSAEEEGDTYRELTCENVRSLKGCSSDQYLSY